MMLPVHRLSASDVKFVLDLESRVAQPERVWEAEGRSGEIEAAAQRPQSGVGSD